MKQFLRKYFNLLFVLIVALLVFFDQWTKRLAVLHLKGKEPFVIWKGVFELSYLENGGTAWGLLQGQQTLFYILTVLFIIVALIELYRLRDNDRFLPFRYILAVILSGAIGNFIDRAANKYVVDFFYIRLIDFPVFNVADCYITFSIAILILLIFFYYTEEEFEIIIPSFKKKRQ